MASFPYGLSLLRFYTCPRSPWKHGAFFVFYLLITLSVPLWIKLFQDANGVFPFLDDNAFFR